jgi:hypothetical protein
MNRRGIVLHIARHTLGWRYHCHNGFNAVQVVRGWREANRRYNQRFTKYW